MAATPGTASAWYSFVCVYGGGCTKLDGTDWGGGGGASSSYTCDGGGSSSLGQALMWQEHQGLPLVQCWGGGGNTVLVGGGGGTWFFWFSCVVQHHGQDHMRHDNTKYPSFFLLPFSFFVFVFLGFFWLLSCLCAQGRPLTCSVARRPWRSRRRRSIPHSSARPLRYARTCVKGAVKGVLAPVWRGPLKVCSHLCEGGR